MNNTTNFFEFFLENREIKVILGLAIVMVTLWQNHVISLGGSSVIFLSLCSLSILWVKKTSKCEETEQRYNLAATLFFVGMILFGLLAMTLVVFQRINLLSAFVVYYGGHMLLWGLSPFSLEKFVLELLGESTS
jgi:hypothetical protein